MAQRTAFGQTVEFFRQIFGVIADPLQRLRCEKDVEIFLTSRTVWFGQMAMKQANGTIGRLPDPIVKRFARRTRRA